MLGGLGNVSGWEDFKKFQNCSKIDKNGPQHGLRVFRKRLGKKKKKKKRLAYHGTNKLVHGQSEKLT